ncbi:MAG: ATP-dependent DNA helicase [Deltaproteobacteria bacterium]|nr:MAG: ATP-dependent DNA helicase [Deltaproteobacteria bacterium]
MKKRFYRSKRPYKRSRNYQAITQMKPGADASLKPVFEKIGIPEKTRFKPDPFQIQAIEAINKSDCLVTAPTGSGKTWIAEQIAQKVMQEKGKVWYATPLKALTNSIHARFSTLFGKENVGILTGDIKENPGAAIIIGTTEILRNQLYDAMHTGDNLTCDLIILDEAHFLGDEERGVVWEEIMIYLPVRIPLLLLSATIGNPFQIAKWLESIRGKRCYVIEEHNRPVPLFPLFMHPSGTLFPLMEKRGSAKKQMLHKKVFRFDKTRKKPRMAPVGKLPPFSDILNILDRYHLLPAIFFLKSRAECDRAIKLCNSEILSRDPDRKKSLLNKINALVSGNPHLENHNQRQTLELTATASHHSGHLPAWKVVVETLMAEGLLDAMFATSTVAAGVNFPARSVVILNSDRFNGVEFMPLTPSEFSQMSGRAGRRGMDHIGFAIILPGKFMDLTHVAKLIRAPALDIESQIHINFSMVLNLLLSHTPDQVKMLLEKSFASYQAVSGKNRGKRARRKYGPDLENLWNDFLDHMDLLAAENFVTENGKLTEDGLWASKLRIDSPLLVAQGIRKNFLPRTDPALLAAIIGAFVNEKEFTDDPLYNPSLPKILKQVFLDARKGLRPFAVDMLKKGFDAPNLFIQPSLLIFLWAHDEPWENLVTRSDFAEGDFARLILRTGDNLRQISKLEKIFPVIAKTARDALDLILKEPVVTFYH